MAVWFRVFEAWAVTRLLSSPAFHRTVRSAHEKYSRLRHGKPMEELGGTNIDAPGRESFLTHFRKELTAQLRGDKAKS